MNDAAPNSKHSMWVGVGKQILSFIIGVVVAAFVVGSARQRVSDLVAWKAEVSPRIERMDSSGTLSFSHFHAEYLRTQARQEEKLKELEKEIKDIEKRVDP